jgi:ribosomal protein S21
MGKNIVRVRVDAPRRGYGESRDERDRTLKLMLHIFKRQYNDAGIGHDLKEHEYFESKARKNRRKRRQSVLKVQQEELQRRFLSGERIKGGRPKIVKNSSSRNEKSYDY